MKRRVIGLDRPLDLRGTLSIVHRGDQTTAVRGGVVWRATRTPEGPGTESLERDGERIVVQAWGEGADWLLEHAPALCGLDDDDSGFVAHHDLVAEVRRRRPGLRIGRTGAVSEAAVASVLEQKVTGKEAVRSLRRIVRAFGEPAPGPAGLLLPPAPDVLAAQPYWVFHPMGVEQKRADTLRRVCAEGTRLDALARAGHEEARSRLQAIRGIGPWTAAEVAAVALGDPDAVSVGDFHLKNVVAWALAGEPRATDERMLELLEPYRGQRGRAVRLIEASGVGPPKYGPRMPLRNFERS